MKPSPSVLLLILTTIGIVITLPGASSSTILFGNLPFANAQPTSNVEDEEQQRLPETQQEAQPIVRQGTAISSQDPLPGHEAMQMATVLPFRQDGTLYSGVITYTASAPAEVMILNMQTLNETEQTMLNATDDSDLETPFTLPLDNQTSIAFTTLPAETSATVPFVGNAVWLHTIDGTPFTATFTVNALILPSQIHNTFSEDLETTDTDTIEDGEGTEEVDTESTTGTDTDGVTEQDDVIGDEEDLEEDAVDTTNSGDEDEENGNAEGSTAADGNAEDEENGNAEGSTAADGNAEDEENGNAEDVNGDDNNQEVIVRIPRGSSSLTDDAYDPNPIEVNTGDTVTWVNDDRTPHTATSGSPESGSTGVFGGTDDSPEIMGPDGDTLSYTFDEAGEFEYYCTLHPNMVGTVIVTED
jgi:plastocyanin